MRILPDGVASTILSKMTYNDLERRERRPNRIGRVKDSEQLTRLERACDDADDILGGTHEWNFIVTKSGSDWDFPFTAGTAVVLTERALKTVTPETLAHEMVHIYQRFDQASFDDIYQRHFSMVKVRSLRLPRGLGKKLVMNPDGPDVRWAHRLPWGLVWVCMVVPSRGKPPEKRAYDAILDKSTLHVKTRINTNRLKRYAAALGVPTHSLYHPNEMAAEIAVSL